MSAAVSAAAFKPCGFTRGELVELLKQVDYGEMKFERYFFTTTPPRHLSIPINDDLTRCIKCGCTIDEHLTGIQASSAGDGVTELKLMIGQLLKRFDFMSSANGICDISDQQSDASQQTKTAVRDSFNRTCVVTGEKCLAGEDARFKVAHIVPRKLRHDRMLMNYFGITIDDLNNQSNLMYLRVTEEQTLDKCEWTFVPAAGGLFMVLRPNGITTGPHKVPDEVSRKMLMIHCLDFHRKHKLQFDEQKWLDLTPRRSTNGVARDVLSWMTQVEEVPAEELS